MESMKTLNCCFSVRKLLFVLFAVLLLFNIVSGQEDDTPPSFDVTLVDKNTPVAAGASAEVTAEISNAGDFEDTQDIILDIDGSQEDSQELQLGGNEIQEMILVWNTEEGDQGEYIATISSEDDDQSTGIEIQEPEEVCDDQIVIEFQKPETGYEINAGESLDVEWHSTNEYCETQTHQESEIILEDEEGNSIEDSVNVGESGGEGFTSPVYYEFEAGVLEELEGTTEIEVKDHWDLDTEAKTREIQIESVDSEDDEQVVGSSSISIESPNGGEEYDISKDLVVEWNSISGFEDGVELIGSDIEVEGSSGRTTSASKNIEEVVGADDSRTATLTIDADDFSTFNEGEWTLSIEDEWDLDSSRQSTTFTMAEVVETDDSDGDDSSDTDSDGDDSESTSSSDSENGSEDDDIDTTEQESDSSDDDGEVDRCPDGFSFDEENEVCLEDSSEEDSSDRLGDSNEESVEEDYVNESNISEEDLESQSTLSETLDVLTWTNAGILLILILLTSGILFWRSNYQLDL